MSVTIDDSLYTELNPADSITGWTGRSPVSNLSIATSGQIEGSGAIEGRLQTGTGDATHNAGGVDFTDDQFYAWFRPTAPIDTFANSGVTMRISGTSGGATNYGQWAVGGSDLGIIGSGGWINFVIDPLVPFTTTNGTPPALAGTAITDKGSGGAFLGGPGMAQLVIDRMVFGTTTIVRGGTGGSPGKWDEAATGDLENGHIKDIAGAIFINSRVRFGDSVGTTSTEFDDQNAVVLFETNMLVGGHVCGFEFEGNSSGTNNVTIGAASGSGVDKVGASGGTWKASGDRPFRVHAIDTNMDATGIFGVSMLGPATIFEDFARAFWRDDAAVFTEFSREFASAATADISPFPNTPAVDDAMYIGHDVPFYGITIDTGTARSGTATLVWEYHNGSSWVALTDVTDGTNTLTTTGPQTVTYAIPDDWSTVAVNSTTARYYIRLRISAFTSQSTAPLLDEGTVAVAGDVRLEDPSCEMISCVLSGMGPVRVRNGAFCKKTTIAGTVAPAKHAALDLGDADPATDTVRDLTIINNARGVLLKGSGDTTYNIRGFTFGGNTNDFRIDFGPTDTVTINLLDGTSSDTALIEANQDLVDAGTTVVFVNAVTVKTTVIDTVGDPIENARVLMEADSGGDLPAADSVTITRTGDTASVAHTAHGLADGDTVVIRGANQNGYNGLHVITNITTNAYDFSTGRVLFADDFNRSNEALETSADWEASGTTGLRIFSNRVTDVVGSQATGSVTTFALNSITPDQFAETTISVLPTNPASFVGPAVRVINSGNTGYTAGATVGGDWEIRDIGGSVLVTGTNTPLAGEVARLEIIGTALELFVDGVSEATVTDGTHSTGQPGLTHRASFSGDEGTQDDFSCGNIPVTPATGTITSTAVILSDLTNASGVLQDTGFSFTSDQPVTGKIRKSTGSPLFITSAIVGTITTNGLDLTIQMIDDE